MRVMEGQLQYCRLMVGSLSSLPSSLPPSHPLPTPSLSHFSLTVSIPYLPFFSFSLPLSLTVSIPYFPFFSFSPPLSLTVSIPYSPPSSFSPLSFTLALFLTLFFYFDFFALSILLSLPLFILLTFLSLLLSLLHPFLSSLPISRSLCLSLLPLLSLALFVCLLSSLPPPVWSCHVPVVRCRQEIWQLLFVIINSRVTASL